MLHNDSTSFKLQGCLGVNVGTESGRRGVSQPPMDGTIAEARGESKPELCLLSHVLLSCK